jgi:Arc/MetJ-type ribon-helix-helix transcriptional regulator
MTIHLPEDLENCIRAEVLRGHFATEDDMVAELVRDYLRRKAEQNTQKSGSMDTPVSPAKTAHKPLWERAAELRISIPAEEWAKLPVDGAEQLDHYIYGSPKRPTS